MHIKKIIVILFILILGLFAAESKWLAEYRAGKVVDTFLIKVFTEVDKIYFADKSYAKHRGGNVMTKHLDGLGNFIREYGILKAIKYSSGELIESKELGKAVLMANYIVVADFEKKDLVRFGVTLIYFNGEWLFYGFSHLPYTQKAKEILQR
ncbi:hypothetical protein [Aliikangiella sp. IMCC44359]|uniref:hypothetical protein n=1 Tax=Aliikangiella sp. IMCC44359 TaxID=3459125 RepID=UPI00403AC97B